MIINYFLRKPLLYKDIEKYQYKLLFCVASYSVYNIYFVKDFTFLNHILFGHLLTDLLFIPFNKMDTIIHHMLGIGFIYYPTLFSIPLRPIYLHQINFLGDGAEPVRPGDALKIVSNRTFDCDLAHAGDFVDIGTLNGFVEKRSLCGLGVNFEDSKECVLHGDQLQEFTIDARFELSSAKTGSAHGPFYTGPFFSLQQRGVGGDGLGDIGIGTEDSHFFNHGQQLADRRGVIASHFRNGDFKGFNVAPGFFKH